MSGESDGGRLDGNRPDDELDAQERYVRDLLRGAADVGPMPDDVVARVDAALRAAQADLPGDTAGVTPVASLAERRNASWRRRLPRVLAAAAGIAVVGGGALFVGLQGPGGADSASSGAAAGGGSSAASEAVPGSAPVLLSGRDYADAAAVRDLGEGVLAHDAGGAADEAAPQGRAEDATPGTGDTDRKHTMLNAPRSTLGPTDAPPATTDEAQRPAAERALACTKQLGVDPGSVLAVEIASWQAQPAAFVVHKTADGAEVVVVALDCTPGDAALSTVPVP
ncbi:hypothetical protein [Kineococcus sp. NPDC059986]|uniref:hypothetical protein n=1 Tax=Kineococcus sp. NPDC059986 TaxID=3155538 RepID=UPI00344B5F15